MPMSSRGDRPNPTRAVRRLFLDDDPERASEFLAVYPDAVWVETISACIEGLQTPWDEVYLDHDLGGEQYVDVARDDCGMAVVRWLALQPRRHLKSTRFIVHSHNAVAAYVMVLQMKALGFKVEASPFGLGRWRENPPATLRLRSRALAWFGSIRWWRGKSSTV
jgi:hypothetical protein